MQRPLILSGWMFVKRHVTLMHWQFECRRTSYNFHCIICEMRINRIVSNQTEYIIVWRVFATMETHMELIRWLWTRKRMKSLERRFCSLIDDLSATFGNGIIESNIDPFNVASSSVMNKNSTMRLPWLDILGTLIHITHPTSIFISTGNLHLNWIESGTA